VERERVEITIRSVVLVMYCDVESNERTVEVDSLAVRESR